MIWKDFSQNVSTEKDFLVYRDNNEKKHKKFVWHFRLTVKLVIDLIQLAWNREFHHRFISIFILWRPFNLTDASPNHFFCLWLMRHVPFEIHQLTNAIRWIKKVFIVYSILVDGFHVDSNVNATTDMLLIFGWWQVTVALFPSRAFVWKSKIVNTWILLLSLIEFL